LRFGHCGSCAPKKLCYFGIKECETTPQPHPAYLFPGGLLTPVSGGFLCFDGKEAAFRSYRENIRENIVECAFSRKEKNCCDFSLESEGQEVPNPQGVSR
jgi:hypothetical protein